MTAALEGGELSAAHPGCTLPPGKTRYPFYSRLGGPQGQSGQAENLVPTGIRSQTVQPVVCRYTDWATRPITVRSSHKNSNRKEAKSVFHHFFLASQYRSHSVLLNSEEHWRIKNQLDATYYFIVLLIGSTCFGHYYAHHQELATITLITTLVISFLVCCRLEVRCG